MNTNLPIDKQHIDDVPRIKETPMDEQCPRCDGNMFRTVIQHPSGAVELIIDCEDCDYKEMFNSEDDL